MIPHAGKCCKFLSLFSFDKFATHGIYCQLFIKYKSLFCASLTVIHIITVLLIIVLS